MVETLVVSWVDLLVRNLAGLKAVSTVALLGSYLAAQLEWKRVQWKVGELDSSKAERWAAQWAAE